MVKARRLCETRVAGDCHGGPWYASRVIERLRKKLNIDRANRCKQQQGCAKRNMVCATAGDCTSSRPCSILMAVLGGPRTSHHGAFRVRGWLGATPGMQPCPISTIAHHHAVCLSRSGELYNSSPSKREHVAWPLFHPRVISRGNRSTVSPTLTVQTQPARNRRRTVACP